MGAVNQTWCPLQDQEVLLANKPSPCLNTLKFKIHIE